MFGLVRCMIVLKKPSWFEKLFSFECFGDMNVVVCSDSSKAYRRPKIVTSRADSFVIVDIVIIGVFIGVIVEIIAKPARILPSARRKIGFVMVLLFSEIITMGLIRVGPICTYRMSRRL